MATHISAFATNAKSAKPLRKASSQKKDLSVQTAKSELKKKFDELLFAAIKAVEAYDYGNSVIEVENAIDELRQTINEIDYG